MRTFIWTLCIALCVLPAGARAADALTWKFKSGQSFEFEIDSVVKTSTAGATSIVTGKLAGKITVTEVDEDTGEAEVAVTFTKIHCVVQTAASKVTVIRSAAQLKGKSVGGEITRRGILSLEKEELEAIAPKGDLSEHFEGLFVKMPENKVSRGHKWTVEVEHAKLDLTYASKAGDTAVIKGKESTSVKVRTGGGLGQLKGLEGMQGLKGLKTSTKVTAQVDCRFDLARRYLTRQQESIVSVVKTMGATTRVEVKRTATLSAR